jgi:hypothetical protein
MTVVAAAIRHARYGVDDALNIGSVFDVTYKFNDEG